MIRATRLFLVPAVSAVLLLIPIIGWMAYAGIVYVWYCKNSETLKEYFQGRQFKKKETSDEELEKLK